MSVRRRLIFVASLTTTVVVTGVEVYRTGYVAPLLFGWRQWVRATPSPRFSEPDPPG